LQIGNYQADSNPRERGWMSMDKQQKRLRAHEVDAIFGMYAALHELEAFEEAAPGRIPPGDTRLEQCHDLIEGLLYDVLLTVPQDKLEQLRRQLHHMRYRVYLAPPVSVPDDQILVTGADMITLAEYAHEYSCTACEQNCNQCRLGKALDAIMIQCRGKGESWSFIDPAKEYTEKDVIR